MSLLGSILVFTLDGGGTLIKVCLGFLNLLYRR